MEIQLLKYAKEKGEKEDKELREKQKLKEEKEKEIQRMREMQERSQDRQSDLVAFRAIDLMKTRKGNLEKRN